jgi:hypothetical protein
MSTTATQCDMMTLVWAQQTCDAGVADERESRSRIRGSLHGRPAGVAATNAVLIATATAQPSIGTCILQDLHTLSQDSLSSCADANTETNCPALLFSGKDFMSTVDRIPDMQNRWLSNYRKRRASHNPSSFVGAWSLRVAHEFSVMQVVHQQNCIDRMYVLGGTETIRRSQDETRRFSHHSLQYHKLVDGVLGGGS